MTAPFPCVEAVPFTFLVCLADFRFPSTLLLEILFGQIFYTEEALSLKSLTLVPQDLKLVLVAVKLEEQMLWLSRDPWAIPVRSFNLDISQTELVSKEILGHAQAVFVFILGEADQPDIVASAETLKFIEH